MGSDAHSTGLPSSAAGSSASSSASAAAAAAVAVRDDTPVTAAPWEPQYPKLRLLYFNSKGRAEVARLIMVQAGVPYEDVRFDNAQWKNEYKAQSPTGQAPVLEVTENGQVARIAQSKAIQRYLAKITGLLGSTPLETAHIDVIVETVDDSIKTASDLMRSQLDQKDKEEKFGKYFTEELPMWAGHLEKMLKQYNKEGTGFFLGSKVSLADLYFFNWWSRIVAANQKSLSAFPLLLGLMDRVGALPKIAKWVRERPVTEN